MLARRHALNAVITWRVIDKGDSFEAGRAFEPEGENSNQRKGLVGCGINCTAEHRQIGMDLAHSSQRNGFVDYGGNRLSLFVREDLAPGRSQSCSTALMAFANSYGLTYSLLVITTTASPWSGYACINVRVFSWAPE